MRGLDKNDFLLKSSALCVALVPTISYYLFLSLVYHLSQSLFGHYLPSFSNLDGATPSPLFSSSTTQSGSSPTTTSDCDEKEEEENIIDIGNCDFDEIAPFCSVYSTPPEKVKSSIPELGIGIFYEIDKQSGHYVYQFQNGRLFEI